MTTSALRPITLVASIVCLAFQGCTSIGPSQLKVTQVDYARALGEAKKRQILATIVGLRFADSPGFLTASQIIVGYDVTASAGLTANTRPSAPGAAFDGTGTLGMTYGSHPTFTFTPATGEAYANFIRPLPPTLILPLSNSQIPIDLLLRVTAQSLGDYQNATMLGEPQGNGSPEFFELLAALRRLQLAGSVSFQYKEVNRVGQVNLALAIKPREPSAVTDAARVRELLALPADSGSFQIAYGDENAGGKATIRLTTRSVLGILGNLGAEVRVAEEDIFNGSTKPTIRLVGGETRPTLIVHSGKKAPADAYVSVVYGSREYWIERTDFDSKYAFTLVQDLMALAESGESAKAPIVTIPAS